MNSKYISNKVVMKNSRKSFSYRRTASGILEIFCTLRWKSRTYSLLKNTKLSARYMATHMASWVTGKRTSYKSHHILPLINAYKQAYVSYKNRGIPEPSNCDASYFILMYNSNINGFNLNHSSQLKKESNNYLWFPCFAMKPWFLKLTMAFLYYKIFF